MMDGSFGPQREPALAFRPGANWDSATQTPARTPQAEPLPEPEWSLSAGQVAFIVIAIIGACELLGHIL